jgi:tRNA pseudouridine55 synthase
MTEETRADAFDLSGGLLRVDKPVGWTSFDVVGKLRGALRSHAGRRLKVGHAGTLDPLASGLLLLGYGTHTKQLPHLTGLDKTYDATLRLGATTPSYDAETDERDPLPWEHLTEAEIRTTVAAFLGPQMQRPPLFSAKRVDGERAYFLARDGSEARMDPVPVEVHAIEVTAVRGREVDITVQCGKGTYIRSLAHDIGQRLGCGAYLGALRRTHIGEHSVVGARTPQGWSTWLDMVFGRA